MATSPSRSLKARALQALAQREQSRAELRRKLLQHARAEDRADAHAEGAAAAAAAAAAAIATQAEADAEAEAATGTAAAAIPNAIAAAVAAAAATTVDVAADSSTLRAAGASSTAAPTAGSEPADDIAAPDGRLPAAARVEAVLDWLEAHRYLSNERFAESRVHARAPRFGNLRIRQELKQHQVQLSADAAQALSASEGERAVQVLERKFPTPPGTAAERARHARFLAGRGFAPESIRHALRSARQVPPAGRHVREAVLDDEDGNESLG